MLDKNDPIFRLAKKLKELKELKRKLMKPKKSRSIKQGSPKTTKRKVSDQNKKNCYYKCKRCGKEIYWNTNKQYISCECGAIAVDGCQDYVRVIGNPKDIQIIRK